MKQSVSKPKPSEREPFYADMNRYTAMAHMVAKELGIRPNEILDEWCAPELIVAFGEYTNEIARKNYNEWKSMSKESRSKTPKPEKYFVQFIGIDEIWNESE